MGSMIVTPLFLAVLLAWISGPAAAIYLVVRLQSRR